MAGTVKSAPPFEDGLQAERHNTRRRRKMKPDISRWPGFIFLDSATNNALTSVK
jgi:hypothetical protein